MSLQYHRPGRVDTMTVVNFTRRTGGRHQVFRRSMILDTSASRIFPDLALSNDNISLLSDVGFFIPREK